MIDRSSGSGVLVSVGMMVGVGDKAVIVAVGVNGVELGVGWAGVGVGWDVPVGGIITAVFIAVMTPTG